jgi:hypothetical protein
MPEGYRLICIALVVLKIVWNTSPVDMLLDLIVALEKSWHISVLHSACDGLPFSYACRFPQDSFARGASTPYRDKLHIPLYFAICIKHKNKLRGL